MKDDFYKDMKHKRAQDEKTGKQDSAKRNSERPQRETLSRSARHKPKGPPENKTKQNSNKIHQDRPKQDKQPVKQKQDSFTNKLKGYFSAENAAKGKAFFAGKLSTYQNRLKNELKISKEKLGSIGSEKTVDKKKNSRPKSKSLPWVLALLILIPITMLFAFLIISNFWPSFEDELASGDSGTEEESVALDEEENDPEFNKELEAQKAEREKRLAENRSGDLSTQDIENSFSQEEMQLLEEEAVAAIRSKEEEPENSAGEPADDEAVETEEDASENAEEAEEDADSASEDEDSDSQESPGANTTHTVGPGDNLYRIALRHYGDGNAANVQRIMKANGVTPDSLSVGQELIIP